MSSEQPNSKNGVLQTLAGSSNQMVQLGTLLAVVLSAVTSTCQTNQLSEQSLVDREKAVREIHLLYEQVEAFERRQLQMMNNQKDLLEKGTTQLANQTEMLGILREGQKQYLQRQQQLFKQGP